MADTYPRLGDQPREDRTRYGTFTLAERDGIVHLEGALPELVAIGVEPWQAFRTGVGMGGPHARIISKGYLEITTPEAEFVYRVEATKYDEHGWYFVARLTYVDRKQWPADIELHDGKATR